MNFPMFCVKHKINRPQDSKVNYARVSALMFGPSLGSSEDDLGVVLHEDTKEYYIMAKNKDLHEQFLGSVNRLPGNSGNFCDPYAVYDALLRLPVNPTFATMFKDAFKRSMN